MRKHILIEFTAVAVLSLVAASSAAETGASAAKKSPAAAKNSLDEELLKSLDSKLLNDRDDDRASPVKSTSATSPNKPTDQPAAKPSGLAKSDDKPSVKPSPVNPIDQELLKSLGGGSDLEAAGEDLGQNQFTKIIGQMRSVESRLAKGNSDAETRKQQQQIAAELTALTEQLRKQCAQCQGGNCDKPGTSSAKSGQPNQASGKSPASNAANQPARNSTTDIRPNRSERPEAATHELLKKALDGLALPEKDRELMLQSGQDEFLPKFAGSIKKYFERIVEEEGEK